MPSLKMDSAPEENNSGHASDLIDIYVYFNNYKEFYPRKNEVAKDGPIFNSLNF